MKNRLNQVREGDQKKKKGLKNSMAVRKEVSPLSAPQSVTAKAPK